MIFLCKVDRSTKAGLGACATWIRSGRPWKIYRLQGLELSSIATCEQHKHRQCTLRRAFKGRVTEGCLNHPRGFAWIKYVSLESRSCLWPRRMMFSIALFRHPVFRDVLPGTATRCRPVQSCVVLRQTGLRSLPRILLPVSITGISTRSRSRVWGGPDTLALTAVAGGFPGSGPRKV